jgi:hypothetical protein
MSEKRYSFKAEFFCYNMRRVRGNIRKYIPTGLVTLAIGLVNLGAYARIWEYKQPKQSIENAQVLDIQQYHYSNDLYWTSNGCKIRIDKLEGLIDFKEKNWDNAIRKGDSIDLVFKKGFPLFGKMSYGIKINAHQPSLN